MQLDNLFMNNQQYLYLANLYLGIKSAQSFSGVNTIWKKIKEDENPYKITRKFLIDFLQSMPSFTIHQRVFKNFKRFKYITQYLNVNFELDLIDVHQYKQYNHNYKYILILIELFSRKVYAAPLKSKSSNHLIKALDLLIQSNNLKIETLYLDKAGEQTGHAFKSYASKLNIRLYYSHQKHHAAHAERAIMTIKMMIFRYFTQNNTLNYISNLDQFILNYNSRFHSSIGVSPISVNEGNKHEIYLYSNRKYFGEAYLKALKQYKLLLKQKKKKKTHYSPSHNFKIGDRVKILNYQSPFSKIYSGSFSTEDFFIYQIIEGDVDRFLVRDKNFHKIGGYLYFQELKKTNPHLKYYIDPKHPQDKGHITLIADRRGQNGQNPSYLSSIQFENGKKIQIWISASDLHSY